MSSPTKCEQGPCWKNYIYVGPVPGVKGSCMSRKKLCNKTTHECAHVCNRDSNEDEPTTKLDVAVYKKCLKKALKRYEAKKLKLCPRGYCTAKHTFDVYPSAYANGFASQVCKGTQKDALGEQKPDESYLAKRSKGGKKPNSLARWFKEDWRNVCEKDEKGEYLPCGSGKGVKNKKDYPYCRPKNKLPGTTVTTIGELTDDKITEMCTLKRSLEQGVDGNPTYIFLE